MSRLPPQTRVQHRRTDRWGVTCPDIGGMLSCCTEDETPVVWDGRDSSEGTDTRDLIDKGPENAMPDPDRCGMGQGEACCIFLAAGAKGFSCERHSSFRWSIIFKRDMHAKRHPTAPYPSCMSCRPGGDAANPL